MCTNEHQRSTSCLRPVCVAIAFLLANAIVASHAAALNRVCQAQPVFALAIHGGAVWGRGEHTSKQDFIRGQLIVGRARLEAGAKSLDIVEAVIAAMEDSGLFNAGKGGVASQAGDIELDASIMEGRHLGAGAVASVKHVRNPISAARWVMENTPHVMMVGPSANEFLERRGFPMVSPSYFRFSGSNFSELMLPSDAAPALANAASPRELLPFAGVWAGVIGGQLTHALVVERLYAGGADVTIALGVNESVGFDKPRTVRTKAKFGNGFLLVEEPAFRIAYRSSAADAIEAFVTVDGRNRLSGKLTPAPELLARGGTVGAVALDRCGDLAAGTSTGGFGSKLPGRVGDSPIIGAGTYADNRAAAVSATGHGEYFIRHVVAHEIVARVRHGGEALLTAAYRVLFKELGGEGGVVAVDKNGEVVLLFNTDGMVRGWTTDRFPPKVETYLNQ